MLHKLGENDKGNEKVEPVQTFSVKITDTSKPEVKTRAVEGAKTNTSANNLQKQPIKAQITVQRRLSTGLTSSTPSSPKKISQGINLKSPLSPIKRATSNTTIQKPT